LIESLIKIAHISDLHVAGKHDRRLLQHLDGMLEHLKKTKVDHLVISGDLTDTAEPKDWQILKDRLIEHDLYDWQKVTVIAGNHDLINLEEEMRFYNVLNPLPGIKKRSFSGKVSRFCSMFSELIASDDESAAGFPFVKIMKIDGFSLAFVAVNSVWPWNPTENPLGARGCISPSELRVLSINSVVDALRESFVIGLCHHAYKVYSTDSVIDQAFDWTMELTNRKEYLEVLKLLGAGVVLHGHFHRFQSYTVDNISFINGGCFKNSPERYSELIVRSDGSFSQEFLSLP
jgi:3',5'-cyclic-AMP phosphodiesterase